jgi:hypothetical protein
MYKKGKLTLYIIIGLVLVVALSTFVYINNSRIEQELIIGSEGSLSFANIRTSAKVYINQCLEESAKNSINRYGLDFTEEQIKYEIDHSLLNCLDRFEEFTTRGYEVTFEQPDSTVIVEESQVYVDLYFPVEFTDGFQTVRLEDQLYKLNRLSTMTLTNGMIEENTIFFSEDQDMVIRTVGNTRVMIDDKIVDKISLKLMGKHFNGNNNGVVIGQKVYEGLPNGASFDPPVRVEMRIDKIDLPTAYEYDEPKLGYFDEAAGLWKTYPGCGVREDDDSYYYCGEVDHFTPIGVVACGKKDAGVFRFQLDYLYESPIQPEDDGDKKGEYLTWLACVDGFGEDCRHIPSKEMVRAHCVFMDEYEGEEPESSGATSEPGDGEYDQYLPDSEETPVGEDEVTNQDAPAEGGSSTEETPGINYNKVIHRYNIEYHGQFPKEKSSQEKCQFMLADFDLDDVVKTIPAESITSTDDVDCHEVCSKNIKKQWNEYYGTNDFPKEIKKVTNYDFDEFYLIFIDGDSIKDNAKLVCTNEKNEPDCELDIDEITFESVMDSQIVATPNTYGFVDVKSETDFDYETIKDPMKEGISLPNKDSTEEYVGGFAAQPFIFSTDGDGCLDTNDNRPELMGLPYDETKKNDDGERIVPGYVEATLLTPLHDDISGCEGGDDDPGEGMDPGSDAECGGQILGMFTHTAGTGKVIIPEDSMQGDGVSCSQGDNCYWVLNPSFLKSTITDSGATYHGYGLSAGLNYLSVYVQNTGGDADAYASAILQFKGTGVTSLGSTGAPGESCVAPGKIGSDSAENKLTVQDRILYYLNCDGRSTTGWWHNDELNDLASNFKDGDRSIELCAQEGDLPSKYLDDDEFSTQGGYCVKCDPGVGLLEGDGRDRSGDSDDEYCKVCRGKVNTFDNNCRCNGHILTQDILKKFDQYDGDVQIVEAKNADNQNKASFAYCTSSGFSKSPGAGEDGEGTTYQPHPIGLKGQTCSYSVGSVDLKGVCKEACGDDMIKVSEMGATGGSCSEGVCCTNVGTLKTDLGEGEACGENVGICSTENPVCCSVQNVGRTTKVCQKDKTKCLIDDDHPIDLSAVPRCGGVSNVNTQEIIDCKCGEDLLSNNPKYHDDITEIFCCNNDMFSYAKDACGGKDGEVEIGDTCSVQGTCKDTCIGSLDVTDHLIYNECGVDKLGGNADRLRCCVEEDKTNSVVCCETKNKDSGKVTSRTMSAYSVCVAANEGDKDFDWIINPYLKDGLCIDPIKEDDPTSKEGDGCCYHMATCKYEVMSKNECPISEEEGAKVRFDEKDKNCRNVLALIGPRCSPKTTCCQTLEIIEGVEGASDIEIITNYCSYMNTEGKAEPVDSEGDCININIPGLVTSGASNCKDCLTYVDPDLDSDLDIVICGGSTGDLHPSLGNDKVYPNECSVCGEESVSNKKNIHYTCGESGWTLSENCGDNGCRDLGDCQAECYSKSKANVCYGDYKLIDTTTEAEEYPVGSYICGNNRNLGYKDNLFYCRNCGEGDIRWVDEDCDGLCIENYDGYSYCNTEAGKVDSAKSATLRNGAGVC